MSSAKRKSLTDAAAAAFVFGDDPTPDSATDRGGAVDRPIADQSSSSSMTEMPTPSDVTPPPGKQTQSKRSQSKAKQGRAIDALIQRAESRQQVRITIDLSPEQHQSLTTACAQLRKSKAEVIRALVDDFLIEVNQ